MSGLLIGVLVLALLVGFAIVLSLCVVGIPAVGLKLLAALFFAPHHSGIAEHSIGWGAKVGTAYILFHILSIVVLIVFAAVIPLAGDVVWALGVHGWSVVGFVVLAVTAVVVDYRMVLRPLDPRIGVARTVGFLAFSNA